MKTIKHSILLLILIIISSCASHTGNISSSLLSEEYVYEDIAFGISQTSQFFGLGGLSKDALILEAKRQLFRSRPLKINESYANFSIDIKRTYILFYSETKVTVSADIVYKGDVLSPNRFSGNYLSKLNTRFIYGNLFNAGDSIVDKTLNQGVIIDVIGNEKFRVLYRTEEDNYRSKKENITNVFSTKKSYMGLNPGDSVEYKSEEVKGIVVALGINGFLYKEKDSTTYFSNYINTMGDTE